MKVKSQMLNNNRVVGIHSRFKGSQNLKEKGKKSKTKRSPVTSPGHQHVPKFSILSQIQTQHRRNENSLPNTTDHEMQLQPFIQPRMEKPTQNYNKDSSKKSVNNQRAQLKSSPQRERSNVHPDDGFLSGAWLFNLDAAPKWFQRELANENGKKQFNVNQSELRKWMEEIKVNPLPNNWIPLLTEDERVFETSGAWLFDLNDMPLWFQIEVQRKSQPKMKSVEKSESIPLKPITPVTENKKKFTTKQSFSFSPSLRLKNRFNAKPYDEDDAFYSGAWLFDESVAPQWLRLALASSSKPNDLKFKKAVSNKLSRKESFDLFAPYHVPFLKNKEKDETEFIDSGAWLFDSASAPTWFQILIYQGSTSELTGIKTMRVVSGFSYHAMNEDQMDQIVFLNRVPIHYPKSMIHEDIGFYSGAWLFDEQAMPEWFKKEYASTLSVSNSKKTSVSISKPFSSIQPRSPHYNERKTKKSSLTTSHLTTSLIHAKALQVDPDYGFYNGGWLFDNDMAPQWLKLALDIPSTTLITTESTHFNPIPHFAKINPNTYQMLPQPFKVTSPPDSAQFKLQLYSNPTSSSTLLIKKNKSRQEIITSSQSSPIQPKYSQAKLIEIDFMTGAWLFDQERVPEWMQKELEKAFNEQVPPAHPQPPIQQHNNRFWKALKRPFWFIAYY